MGQTKIKLFIISLFGFILMVPYSFTYAGTLDLTQACTQDADCVSTKCGQSNLTGAQTKFCVCTNEIQCETKYKKDTGETWTCKPGEAKTKNLAYCLSSTKGIQDPAPTAGTTTPPEAAGTAAKAPIKLTKPVLSIPIPSMPSFSDIEVAPGQKASIPYIAQYVTGIYKYGLTLASILAVMMIVAGGVMYLISSADPSKVATAKQMIFGSITGLTVLLCSYLLLQIINPNIVNPEAIEVETVEEIVLDLIIPYVEGPAFTGGADVMPPGEYPTDVKPVVGPATYKSNAYVYGPVKDKKCLNAYFFPPELKVGDRVDKYIKTINILGLDTFWERSNPNLPVQASASWAKRIERARKAKIKYGIRIHERAVPGWQAFTNELLASKDAEVKGYLQYIWDRAAGKAPSLTGSFNPEDIASTLIGCGAGMKRKSCPTQIPFSEKNPGPYDDPHVLGLAVDLMTWSNWDITNKKYSKSSRGDSSDKWCGTYKKTIDKMRNGEYGEYFKSDPYKMYARMDKITANCLAGKSSGWSFPDGWIDIAVKNKFYWAGWAWADPWRSDAMHFEYYGTCFGLKNETKRPQ